MRPPALEMLHAATSIGRMLEQDLGSGKRLTEVVDAGRCTSVYFSIKRAAVPGGITERRTTGIMI